MMINSDDNDDDNGHISVRIKLDHDDLLIPSSIFPSHSRIPCIPEKLLCWKISLVAKSHEIPFHEIPCSHDDLIKISCLVEKSHELL